MAEKKSDKKTIIGAVIIGILIITIVILVYINYIANPDSQDFSQTNTNNSSQTNDNPNIETSPKTYDVLIINHAFSPSELTIKVRDTVRWTNKDSTYHTVESDFGFEIDSSTLSVGTAYTHTFQTAGIYEYFSVNYPSMKAKIIVN